jgi:hypothetical protein
MTGRPRRSGLSRRSPAVKADDFLGFHQVHVEQETEHAQLVVARKARKGRLALLLRRDAAIGSLSLKSPIQIM